MARRKLTGLRLARRARLALEALEDRIEPALSGAGTGLVGNYFADANLTNLAATRLDPQVDFTWTGAPAPGLPADGFSARWTGKVQAQFAETYTFTVAADEGVRLWVAGQPLVSAWTATTPGQYTGTLALQPGEVYDVRLEATDAAGAAGVAFSWSSPSTTAAAVPATQLYSGGGWLAAQVGTGPAGSLASAGGTYTLTGGGAGTATADAGHFAYQPLGDGATVVARVTPGAAGRAGLAFRGDTSPGAAFAAITVGPGGSSFDFRGSPGIPALNAGVGTASGPTWLKLHRDGPRVYGYTSPTGADGSWNLVGTATVHFANTQLAGPFVTSGSGTATTATLVASVSLGSTAPIGANLDSVVDWNLSKVFVDAMKSARAPTSVMPGEGGTPAALDANGWAAEDAEYIIQTGSLGIAHNYNGTYKLSFIGQANIGLSVTQGSVSNVVYTAATNTTTADVTLTASDDDGGWYFILQFFNTNGGAKDIKLIRPGYAADTTQTFTNEFLAAVEPFGTLRFMDWVRTNNSPNVNWFERALPTDAMQSTGKGVAWEYAVQLANEADKDVWVNIPFHATDDYVRNLATLLRNTLGQDHVVYLEFSNELWNTIFQQSLDNIHAAVAEVEAGMASGTPSDLFVSGETALRPNGTWVYDYVWAMRRIARELMHVSGIFAEVWGGDAINTRVRPVLANQLVNPFILTTQLDYLTRQYGDPRDLIYSIAGTTFFNTWAVEHQTGLTADQVLQALSDSVNHVKQFYPAYTYYATLNGVQHFASEGGADTFGNTNVAAKKAAVLDPRMADLVKRFLGDWFAAGGTQFDWYVAGATSYDTNHGTWGLTNDIGNLNTPKFQAVTAMASAPAPNVTLGVAVPQAVPAAGYYGTTEGGAAYLRSLTGGRTLDYLVRAPVAGNYRIALDYAATAGGLVEVSVNGVVVGTIALGVTGPGLDGLGAPNQFGISDTLTVRLDSGLSVVRLKVLTGGFSLRTAMVAAPEGTIVSPPPPPVGPPPVVPPPPGVNQPPTIATAAAATAGATTAALTVLGADDAGEAGLTYTWSLASGPSGVPAVTFAGNGTNAAKTTTATFGALGAYTLRVTVADAAGASVTSTVLVRVTAVATTLTVSPGTAVLAPGGTVAFAAAAVDQFGRAFAPAVAWTVDTGGSGSVTSGGLYTAGAPGAATVRATVNGLTAAANVTVSTTLPPTVPPPGGGSPPPPPPSGGGPLPPPGVSLPAPARGFAVGRDAGGAPTVRLLNPDGSERWAMSVFDPTFTGGVRTASADFNGDGVLDVVAATGPGVATEVRVIDGATRAELFRVNPFEASFTGGLYVAAGDLTGDGVPDLVITPDEGGGPRARVFGGNGFRQVADFFGIDDTTFRGGARPAVGDVNGDGRADLIVAAGFGGGPRVTVWDGTTVGTAGAVQLANLFVFEQALRNGVYVTAGDLNGDGFADLIAGGGPGGGPRVFALSGKDLTAGRTTELANFFAGDVTQRGGVRVAVADLDGDAKADLLAGAAKGGMVTGYAGGSLAANVAPDALLDLSGFPGFSGGVFVG